MQRQRVNHVSPRRGLLSTLRQCVQQDADTQTQLHRSCCWRSVSHMTLKPSSSLWFSRILLLLFLFSCSSRFSWRTSINQLNIQEAFHRSLVLLISSAQSLWHSVFIVLHQCLNGGMSDVPGTAQFGSVCFSSC